jgi:hypothetical protein
MSEQAPDRILSGIDIPKTIAGVLAAVSAAVVGSFLGVAGTLAGAAIASVVGSVGTEVYRKLVARGQKKIVATFVTAPAAVGTPEVAAAADESPSDEEPVTVPAKKMRWGRVAMVAAGMFLLAIGSLTAFELISGESAADAVGHHSSSSTTVGSVFGGSSNSNDTTPATTPTSTSPSPTATTTEAPATTEPTTATTTEPTQSAAPTDTAAPTPTATDTQTSGGQTGSGQNDEAPPATQGTE